MTKVKLRGGVKLAPEAVKAAMAQLPFALPKDYLDFASSNDGAKPETNVVKIPGGTECGISQFIPIKDILPESMKIDDFPLGMLPIAWGDGGNYFLISASPVGTIYFWDHELPDVPVLVAKSFTLFTGMVEPFDPSTIQLQPDQAKVLWVDPEFFKSLKKADDDQG